MSKTIRDRLPDEPTKEKEILIQGKINLELVKKARSKMEADKKRGKIATWKSLITASLERYVEEK